MLISKYPYKPLVREPINGVRHYICPSTGKHIPSVTTILDRTSDKSGLLEWRKRVGEAEANRISKEALALGTLMHTHLECFLEGRERPGGTNLVRKQAETMADLIIEHGLSKVSEVYGSEVGIYFPGLYAGTMDSIGLYELPDGRVVEAILDFKTARKMKKKEHIENYFCQLTAYGLASDELYGTNIKAGVIFMADRDFDYKHFIIEGAEYDHYADLWLNRLEQYYA
jgi:genome maintenance exonuclease 1